MRKMFFVVILLSLICNSCGVFLPLTHNKDKLSKLELLMVKNEVTKKIGEPDEIRGSINNIDGDIVTVWQYNLHNKSQAGLMFVLGIFTATITWWITPSSNGYWLYFVDDILAQWGRAGDWQPDLIMNVRLENK